MAIQSEASHGITASTWTGLDSTAYCHTPGKSPIGSSANAANKHNTLDGGSHEDSGYRQPTQDAHAPSTTHFTLEDCWIDEPRSLKVAVIGAGLTGILAGILLPSKVPGLDLTIFEKNGDVSGTWLENTYPGVRCDIPAHVYQATFSPNTQWSEKFAQGNEIRDYWQAQARKYKVYEKIKLNTRVQSARWDQEAGKWSVVTKKILTDEPEEEIQFDFVLPAIGRFNAWRLPDYPGISEYQGLIRHTSNWDPAFDAVGKRVAVIGNGASGIQVVPNLQRVAARVDHYARSKTWIAGSWAGDERKFEAQPYSSEEKRSFEDGQTYLNFRKDLEDKYWRRFNSTIRDSIENKEMRANFIDIMRERLKKKPELLHTMIPDFSPNCRRLTPGPGYLEALTEENVDFIQTPIKTFTKSGITTVDGTHREIDAVFCATGANVDFVPPFTIEAYGVDLKTAWKHDGDIGWPRTYLGLAAPGFPNLLFIAGPHGAGPSGTVPHSAENQLTYYAKILRKVSTQGIRIIMPKEQAVRDFTAYLDAFFATTVLTDNCSSWANGGRPGGRIHGIWPGSAAHVTIVRREPRWEDWDYEYINCSGNRFAYFGKGWTRFENSGESDMTAYLKDPDKIDLRDVHESWWDMP